MATKWENKTTAIEINTILDVFALLFFFFAYRISFRHKASNASGKATDVVFSLPCALVWRVQKPNRHTNVDYVLF